MIGVSTIFFGYLGMAIDKKVKRIIDIFAKAQKQPFVQIGASRPGMPYDEVVNALQRFRRETGVEYSIHQSIWLPSDDFYLNIASSNDHIRRTSIDSLKKSIDFARRIESQNVSFHAGYATDRLTQVNEFQPLDPVDEIPYDNAYNNSVASLNELIDYANGEIRLSIENFNHRPERRYMFSLPEDFAHLPKNVGVIANVGHLFYTEQLLKNSSYVKNMIEAFKSRVMEMHLNDNDGSEDQHMLVGHGKIPVEEMVKLTSINGRVPKLIIESHKSRHSYSDTDLVENIKTMHDMSERLSSK